MSNNLHTQHLEETIARLEAEAQALRDQVKALQSDASSYQSGYDEGRRMGTKHRQSEVDQLTREVEALRAKVVVDEYAEFEAWLEREKPSGCIGDMERGWMERARLNGKVVSEELLCEAKRHLGNWLELHECECEGGLHYCGRDQVAKTHRELRALLDEGKEVGHETDQGAAR